MLFKLNFLLNKIKKKEKHFKIFIIKKINLLCNETYSQIIKTNYQVFPVGNEQICKLEANLPSPNNNQLLVSNNCSPNDHENTMSNGNLKKFA